MSYESDFAWLNADMEAFYQKIGTPEPVIAAIRETEAAAGGWENMRAALEAYDGGTKVFAAAAEELSAAIGIPVEQVVLALYARLLAGRSYREYCRIGIPEKVFADTMAGLNNLAERGFRQYGYYAIPTEVYRSWFRRNIDLTLFTLGRLQFELRSYVGPDNELCRADERVIYVHIPARGVLSEENCEASYAEARVFFRRYYGMEKVVFVCSSWLMDPQWSELLGERSRIRDFQNHYRILTAEPNIPSAARWIFEEYREDPREYPTDTSLRRIAVQLLLSGGTLNIGLGIRT